MRESVQLPEGWARASLAEVVIVNPKHKDLDDQVAGFVPMKLAPTDFNGTLNYEERDWDKIKKGYTHFATGDVIFAKVTPCFENGKAAIVKKIPNGIGAGSTEFYVLRPANNDISVDYVFSVIKSYEFLHSGAENMTGAVGLRRVPKKFVEDFKINLPPVAEQKEIVAQLDNLLTQVESTKARLDAIPAILKRFRQSVLAAAVSGKLTDKWRRTKNVPMSSWKLAKVSDYVKAIEAGKSLKCIETPPEPEQFGIIKISAVTWGKYDENESKTLPDSSFFMEARRVNIGDFLISRANTIELLGNPVIVHKVSKNLMLSDKVLRLVMEECDKPWVSIYLRSKNGRREIETRSTGNQMSMRNIGQKALLGIEIPKPTEKEQTEIVRRVEELFTYADTVEAQVNAAQQRVNNLTQSILAKAFSGDLTALWRAQNPGLISGENSATALLEKINEERELLAKIKKPLKKKKVTRKPNVKKTEKVVAQLINPVERVLAAEGALSSQQIFDKLTDDLSLSDVFSEIAKLLADQRIEEVTEDGVKAFSLTL